MSPIHKFVHCLLLALLISANGCDKVEYTEGKYNDGVTSRVQNFNQPKVLEMPVEGLVFKVTAVEQINLLNGKTPLRLHCEWNKAFNKKRYRLFVDSTIDGVDSGRRAGTWSHVFFTEAGVVPEKFGLQLTNAPKKWDQMTLRLYLRNQSDNEVKVGELTIDFQKDYSP